jgi:hypothetical protein
LSGFLDSVSTSITTPLASSSGAVSAVTGGAPVAGWDGLLAPEDFYQCNAWLQVMDEVGGNDITRLLWPAQGRPTAGLATVVATADSPWLLGRPDTLLQASADDGQPGAAAVLASVGEPAALLPALVAGGRHLGRTRPIGPAASDAEAIEQLLQAAEDLALAGGLRSLCLPHVDERDTTLIQALRQAGYAEHESAVYCWLPVPAGGVEEYLAGVSKHRRRRVRLARRQLAEAGVELGVQPLAAADLDRLGELEAALLLKYGNPATPAASTKLLRLIADRLAERALVSYGRLDGQVIAFGLVLCNGTHWFGHRAGFDYAKQGDLPLYEEVLYYRVMDEAAPLGVEVLHAGIGSAEVKKSLHCESATEYSFLKLLAQAAAR